MTSGGLRPPPYNPKGDLPQTSGVHSPTRRGADATAAPTAGSSCPRLLLLLRRAHLPPLGRAHPPPLPGPTPPLLRRASSLPLGGHSPPLQRAISPLVRLPFPFPVCSFPPHSLPSRPPVQGACGVFPGAPAYQLSPPRWKRWAQGCPNLCGWVV
eukprot:436423-Prorocentrum_minimum.AAC.3